MFCRIGDFYELFYEDAILVARELQLTLTARDKEKKQPMCGVPYHAAEIYIQRLFAQGLSHCAVRADGRPKKVKGIVKREVTRVLTPGTAVDPGLGAGEVVLACLRGLLQGVHGTCDDRSFDRRLSRYRVPGCGRLGAGRGTSLGG